MITEHTSGTHGLILVFLGLDMCYLAPLYVAKNPSCVTYLMPQLQIQRAPRCSRHGERCQGVRGIDQLYEELITFALPRRSSHIMDDYVWDLGGTACRCLQETLGLLKMFLRSEGVQTICQKSLY